MKVSAINNSAMQNKTNSVSSKAHLKVLCSAESAIKGDIGKFREVCYLLSKKLSAETKHPGDVVILRAITGKAKNIQTGSYTVIPGHWENRGGYGGNVFVRDTIRSGQYGEIVTPAPTYQSPSYSSENLELAINESKCGFYYNDDHSKEQIAEDLFNAYKHVRYVEHYENPNIIDRFKNWWNG